MNQKRSSYYNKIAFYSEAYEICSLVGKCKCWDNNYWYCHRLHSSTSYCISLEHCKAMGYQPVSGETMIILPYLFVLLIKLIYAPSVGCYQILYNHSITVVSNAHWNYLNSNLLNSYVPVSRNISHIIFRVCNIHTFRSASNVAHHCTYDWQFHYPYKFLETCLTA